MNTLKSEWFLQRVPGKPMGRYAHIIMLRVTDLYPLFQVYRSDDPAGHFQAQTIHT